MGTDAGSEGATLEVRQGDDGPEHLLAGTALRSGQDLEVRLAAGGWLRGRYEARAGAEDLEAWLYVPVAPAAGAEGARHLEAPLPAGALYRLPPA